MTLWQPLPSQDQRQSTEIGWASQAHSGKKSTCQCKRCVFDCWVRKISWRRKWQHIPFLPEMATRSILAWKIPWTVETGRLQSMELQRVGHNWAEIVNNWPSGTFQMQTNQWLRGSHTLGQDPPALITQDQVADTYVPKLTEIIQTQLFKNQISQY